MAAIDLFEGFVFVLAKYFVSPAKFSHENNTLIFLFHFLNFNSFLHANNSAHKIGN
jgi:hypothetical protein